MLEQNPDKVKIVFKHFPLGSHQFAALASLAATAAQSQGKFWQYNKMIFDNYRQLTPEKFQKFAKELNLNMPLFNKQMNSKESKERVSTDFRDGREAGVTGTPTIYINGRLLRKRSLPAIQKIIDQELK